MSGFFDALSVAILPVFAVPVIGYAMGKRGAFDRAAAEAINRFVFLLAVPALTVVLLATADISNFQWGPLLIYSACSLTIYTTAALTAHRLLGIEPREAVLLGLACAFTNQVFFVLPIATKLYGTAAALPVVAVITVDSVVLFSGTVIAMEVIAHRGGGARKVAQMLVRNPLVIGLTLGIAIMLSGIRLHDGILTFLHFLGNSAAPASLFALGVIVSAVPLSRFRGAGLGVALVKVVAMPLMVLGGLTLSGQDGVWADTTLLVAAGPCGAMPFVVGLRYGVATDRIAAAIIISTLISTATLAALA